MTQLRQYLERPNQLLFCDRQGLHQEQPLDLVCLHPLCRNKPLACSVCFSQIHRFHPVITLAKFYDDYTRNGKKFDKALLSKQISTAHGEVNEVIKQMRQVLNESLSNFQNHVDRYAEYLQSQMEVRYELSRDFGVELDTERMKKLINLDDLMKSVKFVLDNSAFDDENNMVEISQLIACNSSRIMALASKLEYMTYNCRHAIKQAMDRLDFAQDTIRKQKITAKTNIQNSQFELNNYQKSTRLPDYFPEYGNLSTSTIRNKKVMAGSVDKDIHRADDSLQATPIKKKVNFNISRLETEDVTKHGISISHSVEKSLKCVKQIDVKITPLKFLTLRHPALKVPENKLSVKSTINAIVPQFALAQPHVQLHPLKISKWAIKIKKCRNFSCLNTLAVGLVHLSQMQQKRFEGSSGSIEKAYLLNSEGDVFLPKGGFQNIEMRFSQGQTLYFSYDPFYHLLSIKKQNGKILNIRTSPIDNDPLYFCVRMTYASDQVQMLQN